MHKIFTERAPNKYVMHSEAEEVVIFIKSSRRAASQKTDVDR